MADSMCILFGGVEAGSSFPGSTPWLKQSNKITYKSRHLCFHKRTTPKHTTLNLPRLKNCHRWRIVDTLTSSPW